MVVGGVRLPSPGLLFHPLDCKEAVMSGWYVLATFLGILFLGANLRRR